MNKVVVPRELLALSAPQQVVGTILIMLRKGSFTKLFLVLGFCIIVFTLMFMHKILGQIM